MARAALCLAGCLLLAGCDSTPRAPALNDEAVYSNPEAGLTFLTPEGWTITGRTVLPPGPLDHPVRLVSYVRPLDRATAARGNFDVYVLDLAPTDDVPGAITRQPLGAEEWTLTEAAPPTYRYAGAKRPNLRRTVTAAPRPTPDSPGRTTLFVGVTTEGDRKAQEALERTLASVEWK